MQSVFRDLAHWFWRLVPANPILVRVVYAGSRRLQHLWIRVGYLGILAFAVVIGVLFVSRQGGSSLSELAKSATVVFQALSVLQLAMVCVLAPIFTSAAITQEKNSQTFNILLSTPLTNGQIVLGSLLSRLYFVFMLLLAGIPLFCILMVYGGVTGDKILLSIAIAGGTAMLTGSIAIAISVIRIGTGRTIFSFYLAIAMYLIIVYALSSAPAFIPVEAQPAPGKGASSLMSWLAAFHPFLALSVILGQTPAPDYGSVAHYGFPRNLWLAYPQYSFIVMTIIFSILLVSLSLCFVRHGSKEGEDSFWNRVFSRKKPDSEGVEVTRKPRTVQKNPIAWRESKTGAAAGGGRLMRWSIWIGGALIALLTLIGHIRGWWDTPQTRALLFGVVAVELFIALFIATATSATSMTREKESNTLELVLATPLTSNEIIWGKIRGLVTAAGPILAVPYATVVLLALGDLLRLGPSGQTGPVVYWQSLLSLPGLFLGFAGVACMIGLWASIKNKKTLGAVFSSMAIVIVMIGVGTACGFTVRSTDNTGLIAAAMSVLSPLTATWVALNPEAAVSDAGTKLTPSDLAICRNSSLIASICSAGICYLVIWFLNKTMVRNFDMTIRKQSA